MRAATYLGAREDQSRDQRRRLFLHRRDGLRVRVERDGYGRAGKALGDVELELPRFQQQFGAAGLRVAERLFGAWGEFRGDGDRNRLLERVAALQEELGALLAQAARKSARHRRHRTFAKNPLKRWSALWTFASVPGVEPTNNHAERGLRGAVIYRKLSLGSQSEHGERTIERILSASVTCRPQLRSLLAYLNDVLAAKIRGDPVPLVT